MWAAWAEVVRRQGVSYIDKIYIFEILIKNVRNIYHPAKLDEIFLKVGTPREAFIFQWAL